jgi:Fe-S oxidoreductase
MNPLIMSILLIVGLSVFAFIMAPRIRLLLHARPADRFNHWGDRVKAMLQYAAFQYRMPRDLIAGLAHIAIFSGFMVLSLRTITLFVKGFSADFEIPGFIGQGYMLFKDGIWILVLSGVSYGLWRRLGPKESRVGRSREGVFVLTMILLLGITDITFDGAGVALRQHSGFLNAGLPFNPLGYLVARLFFGASPGALHILEQIAYWLHCLLILVFLNFLPIGKHFHVLTSFFNVFFSNLDPRGAMPVIDLETTEKYGMATSADLTWSQILNVYSCTECGRCTMYCPTVLTGKPLEHRRLNLDLKHALYAEKEKRLTAKAGEVPELKPLVTEAGSISPDTIWACTTCYSCEQECPVLIENIPRIIEMRQNKVLMEGDVPAELARAFKGMENNYNPWGIGHDTRADWAKGLDVPIMADWAAANPEAEPPLLFWVGCAGSFDDRVKQISLAMVKILRAANVPFAILGLEEACTGDSARRAGNEYLFQTLAQQNIATLNNYRIKRIMTFCPHCYHTLKVDYPALGGKYEVIHHTTLIRELLHSGQLKLEKKLDMAFCYHDSCYLGRYHQLYEDPRAVIKAVPGTSLQEFPRHESRSVCCGAGGGRFWMEETIGQRINVHRVEEAIKVHAQNIASACPFCLTMLSDGLKAHSKDEEMLALDIAEIVARALPASTPPV